MWYFILSLFIFLSIPSGVLAKYDPLSRPNNKLGIHILDVNDLFDAERLVNSSGGLWGYVTVVIQEDDRNFDKWQGIFDQMRRSHLIPIVRLATKIQGDSWAIPQANSIDDWARFLDSLNWPIENRYVSLFNEPNHANEWGKSINPEEYARFTYTLAQKLHATSNDFFVMPAGLDVSAASDGRSLSADIFAKRMVEAQPDYFNAFDGLASHSYPNPAFSGSVYAQGRGSLRSYQWELDLYKSLGLSKQLPVFITETGWVHDQGISYLSGAYSSEQIGSNLLIAASQVWSDPNIVAVTPFALSYQGAPFDHFSWKRLGVSEFYPQYYAYQGITKIKGAPKQHEKYVMETKLIPPALVGGAHYTLKGTIKNEGQAILSSKEGYVLRFESPDDFSVSTEAIPNIEPQRSGEISITIDTSNDTKPHLFSLALVHEKNIIPLQSGIIKLIPPSAIKLSVQLGWRSLNNASPVTVLVYDHLTLLHKFNGLTLKGGVVEVEGLRNIVPNSNYRVVILVPYYLPRQIIAKLGNNKTTLRMPRLYPLDFNNDGKWSISDIFQMFRMKPNQIISLFAGL